MSIDMTQPSLRDRLKAQGQRQDTPPTLEANTLQKAPTKPPREERNVQGWILRIVAKDVGTMTSPSGGVLTMTYAQGIASTQNTLPVFNHDAAVTLLRTAFSCYACS